MTCHNLINLSISRVQAVSGLGMAMSDQNMLQRICTSEFITIIAITGLLHLQTDTSATIDRG